MLYGSHTVAFGGPNVTHANSSASPTAVAVPTTSSGPDGVFGRDIRVDIAKVTTKMISMYTLVFTATARRHYEALVGKIRGQVDKGLARIASHPEHGKPLRGELRGIWSERVATFRILYKIHAHAVEVLILTIEHRKGVYGGH